VVARGGHGSPRTGRGESRRRDVYAVAHAAAVTLLGQDSMDALGTRLCCSTGLDGTRQGSGLGWGRQNTPKGDWTGLDFAITHRTLLAWQGRSI
jgi:hypothetical protein